MELSKTLAARAGAAVLAGCLLMGPTGAVTARTIAAEAAPAPPAHILARTPEAYRATFEGVSLSAAELAKLRDASAEKTFQTLARKAAATPAGYAALVAELAREAAPARRIAILEALADAAADSAAPIAPTQTVLLGAAKGDADLAVSLRSLELIDEFAQRDLLDVLAARLQAAKAAGNAADARRLRDAIDRFAHRDIKLPAFAYRAPPKFAVAPDKAERVRVLAFGDYGTGDPGQVETASAMRAFHKRAPFTFAITTGDNFYGQGLNDPEHPRWKTQYEDLYSPMGVKFYPTLGNHDYGDGDSPAGEIARTAHSKTWTLPAPFYTFTAGAAQFFAIDTVRMTDAQLEWLDRELKASTATWKIVYGHHQMFSATRGDNDHRQMDLIGRLLPVLTANGVHAYICGHDHNLQELKPEGGTHFFVMGAGGAGLYDFNEYPRSLFKAKEHGFGVIEATSTTLDISLVGLNGAVLHARRLEAAARR